MATAGQLNRAHEDRERERVRPKEPVYDFTELEKVMRVWASNERSTL